MTFGKDAHDWLGRSIGITTGYLDIAQMKGSTSSSVFLIQCARGANPKRFVLRVKDYADATEMDHGSPRLGTSHRIGA